jgi:hypothetical protein
MSIKVRLTGIRLILIFTALSVFALRLPADYFILSGLEDATNQLPFKLYRLDGASGRVSLQRTVSADLWFKAAMVDSTERYALFWTYDLDGRDELDRRLTREERRSLIENEKTNHVIVVDLDKVAWNITKIGHSAIFGGTFVYDGEGTLCAMTPDYTNEVASLVAVESGRVSVMPLNEAPWGRLVLRGPLLPTDDPRRINPSAIYRFIIDRKSGKLCHYMGSLEKEHKRFAASERLPDEILERYAASECIRGWLECGNASVGLYRFFPEGSDGVLSEECDWLIHDRSRDGWSWKSDYDFIGYALLFDERIVFYEGQWEGAKEHFSGYFVRTGRHRCTDLVLNTLFEFELPVDAMVLNIIDNQIIYRTGTTLWAVPIIDNQRIGESEELCTDSRLEYANWVAPAPDDSSKDE